MSVRDTKGYVDDVPRNRSVTGRGMIGSLGRTIGTDAVGDPATGLEVVVRDGMINRPSLGCAVMLPPLRDFLDYGADALARSELLSASGQLETGRRYFTYNTFDAVLDAQTQLATLEDELDVGRAETVAGGVRGASSRPDVDQRLGGLVVALLAACVGLAAPG